MVRDPARSPMSDHSDWYPLPGTDFKIPMPSKDLFLALFTVAIFIPVVIICQWLVPFNKNPYKRADKAA